MDIQVDRKRNRYLNIVSVLAIQILTIGLNFILSPYLASAVDKSAYGFVSLANNFTSYASLVTVALNSMASRFIVIALHKNDEKKANRYFSSTIFANLVISVFFLFTGFVFVANLNKFLDIPKAIIKDVKILFTLLFLSFILSTASSVFGVCYYALGKLYVQNLRTMESTFFKLLIIIVLFISFKPQVYYISIATLFATLYLIAFNIYYSKKYLPQLSYKLKLTSWNATRKLISSGIWNTVNMLGTTLTEGLDLLFCNIYIGAESMGLLAYAKTVPTVIRGLMSTLGGIYTPEVLYDYAKDDNEKLSATVKSSMRTVGWIMNIPVSCFIGFGIPFFRLWLPLYDANKLYILSTLSILETTFSTSVSPVYNLFTAANRLKIPSIAHVIGGVFSSLMVLIILNTTNVGVYAIAGVSSIIGIVKIILVILPFGSKILNKPFGFLNKYSIKAAVSIWGMAGVGFMFSNFVAIDSWAKFFLYGIIYAGLVFAFNILFWYRKGERILILKVIKNLLIKR